MRTTAFVAVVCLLFATLAPAQTTYPTQSQPTQPQPSSPCTTSAPCPPPAASQPDTAAPPPTSQAPNTTTQPQVEPGAMSAPSAPAATAQPGNAAPPATDSGTQSSQPALEQRSATTPAGPRTVAAGTTIDATLDSQLSTKTSKPGDTFTATVNQPVQGTPGEALIPAGAKIHGEVAQAEQGKMLPAVRGRGQLNLRFTTISLPDGTQVPLQATLVSVHDTKSGAKTNEEGQVSGGTSGGQAAKNVGIGAGLGTVAGLIFGSALKGLAIGALAGGGYVLAQGGKDVNLPQNTGLHLRVDQNLALPASR